MIGDHHGLAADTATLLLTPRHRALASGAAHPCGAPLADLNVARVRWSAARSLGRRGRSLPA
jgi:hypothetical protein